MSLPKGIRREGNSYTQVGGEGVPPGKNSVLTDTRLTSYLKKVGNEYSQTAPAALPAKPEPSPIGQRRGTGKVQAGTGGSIAGPLAEPDYAARTYHPPASITSSDGILTIAILPLKSLSLEDGNGKAVVVNLAAPPA